MTYSDARVTDAVLVELDVYSGRPNPTWSLEPAEAIELDARLRAASEQRGSAPPSPALGYRGLTVQVGAGGHTVVVGRGTVTVTRGGITTVYRDDGRALERWLLHTGRGHLEVELLDYVNAEIARESP